ncbi:MAG: hypothetical protein J2P48_21280 [Alphaproteobacteria bacterium]|nr:hypothetical protein [Alphaproteobacteria bacterium]
MHQAVSTWPTERLNAGMRAASDSDGLEDFTSEQRGEVKRPNYTPDPLTGKSVGFAPGRLATFSQGPTAVRTTFVAARKETCDRLEVREKPVSSRKSALRTLRDCRRALGVMRKPSARDRLTTVS